MSHDRAMQVIQHRTFLQPHESKGPTTFPGCQKVGGPPATGVDGSLTSGFSLFSTTRPSSTGEKLVLNETAPRWERLPSPSSSHALNNPPSGRARLLLEPRRSAVLISGLTTHGGGLGPFLAV